MVFRCGGLISRECPGVSRGVSRRSSVFGFNGRDNDDPPTGRFLPGPARPAHASMGSASRSACSSPSVRLRPRRMRAPSSRLPGRVGGGWCGKGFCSLPSTGRTHGPPWARTPWTLCVSHPVGNDLRARWRRDDGSWRRSAVSALPRRAWERAERGQRGARDSAPERQAYVPTQSMGNRDGGGWCGERTLSPIGRAGPGRLARRGHASTGFVLLHHHPRHASDECTSRPPPEQRHTTDHPQPRRPPRRPPPHQSDR